MLLRYFASFALMLAFHDFFTPRMMQLYFSFTLRLLSPLFSFQRQKHLSCLEIAL